MKEFVILAEEFPTDLEIRECISELLDDRGRFYRIVTEASEDLYVSSGYVVEVDNEPSYLYSFCGFYCFCIRCDDEGATVGATKNRIAWAVCRANFTT